MGNNFTSSSATGSATYSDDDDISAIGGGIDVNVYADVDADGDAGKIATNKENARKHSYDWINSKLRGAGLTAPATTDNFSEFGLLDDIEAERALAWLYFKRGKQDQGTDAAGQMQWHWDNAEKELDRIIGAAINNAADSADTEGMTAIMPDCPRECW